MSYAPGARFAYVASRMPADRATGYTVTVFRIAESGDMDAIQHVAMNDPVWLAMDRAERFLYCAGGPANPDDGPGTIESWAVDHATGKLTPISRIDAAAALACHMSLSPSGRRGAVAAYGGAVELIAIAPDGALGDRLDVDRRTGSGPKPKQESPHPHAAVFDRSGRYVVTADIGTDAVDVFDVSEDRLRPVGRAALPAGEGPRHVAFHPDGSRLYVNTDLGGRVFVLPFDIASGRLGEPVQAIRPLPDADDGQSTSEIRVHPSGRFVYVANRRDASRGAAADGAGNGNSITRLEVGSGDGGLSGAESVSRGLDLPAAMEFDPAGRSLYAVNRGSGEIVRFSVDWQTGKLTHSGVAARVHLPVSIAFKC